ncbi:hypothetical protein KUV89_15140 [Marinobacter hydrocarbonoclasticus]|nr:hypothetical protein [Marinobacter nauticus]
MNKWKLVLVATLMQGLLVGCSITSVRMHEDHSTHLSDMKRIAIVPPIIEMEKLNFDGENERLPEQEEAIKAQLVARATDRLEAQGFEVRVVERGEMETQFANFNFDLAALRESYTALVPALYDGKPVSEKDMASFSQSVGEAASIVAHYTESDGILLVRYSGWEKSAGNVAKDVASSVLVGVLTAGMVVPVQATSGEMVEAALIDGDTGAVVWSNIMHWGSNDGTAIENNFTQLEKLERPVEPIAEQAEEQTAEQTDEPAEATKL